MDIEKLTKHQIVLLTLLVSFMTSIATGIVTVSLMDQAPPEVSRTINQIVERTVEQVAAPAAAVVRVPVTKETTVVVKDDDAVAGAIASAQQSMVRIVSVNDPQTLVARGIIVDGKGAVISDRGSLEPMGTLKFEAYLPDGTLVPAVMRAPAGTTTLAVLDLSLATSTKLIPIAVADPAKLKLGQSIILLGGNGGDAVATGVIAKLPTGLSVARRGLVEATVLSATPGSVLLNLFGEVVGITTTDSLSLGQDFYTLMQ
jgi:hypothetical protein